MAASTDVKKCIFVVGPTASGKSSWALEQAEIYNGSIVNIDSVQFYKDLLIGSAAPTAEEKKRAPHHLYSYVEAPEEMTAGKYLRDFYELLKTDVRFPLFITGGTGFYIQALEKGMFDVEPVPAEIRTQLEAELAKSGAEKLHEELLQKDPQSKIHVNDHYRLVRALEIIRHTGVTPTALKTTGANKNEFPFASLKVGFDFDKPEFEKRVALRTEAMLAAGLIEETKGFFDRGLESWAPLQSVGYRETVQFLKENQTTQWLSATINRSTWQLIKKQKTWFKRDASVLWSGQQEHLRQFLS